MSMRNQIEHHKQWVADGADEDLSAQAAPRFAKGTLELAPLCKAALEMVRSDDVACIVHDLKSPLHMIGVAVSLLDVTPNDATSKRALDAIRSSATYMDRMVRDLLDCTHDGPLTLSRKPVSLAQVLQGVISRTDGLGERARVVLEVRDRPVMLIDITRIERVITNLLTNALTYSPAASRVVVRLEASRGVACVSVIDRGPGVDPDEADDIFNRYRRGSAGMRTSGSGLGLYASRRIVELHGGTIGVEPADSCGSRFFVELPITVGGEPLAQ
jgi:signal transduction histidine kinase